MRRDVQNKHFYSSFEYFQLWFISTNQTFSLISSDCLSTKQHGRWRSTACQSGILPLVPVNIASASSYLCLFFLVWLPKSITGVTSYTQSVYDEGRSRPLNSVCVSVVFVGVYACDGNYLHILIAVLMVHVYSVFNSLINK